MKHVKYFEEKLAEKTGLEAITEVSIMLWNLRHWKENSKGKYERPYFKDNKISVPWRNKPMSFTEYAEAIADVLCLEKVKGAMSGYPVTYDGRTKPITNNFLEELADLNKPDPDPGAQKRNIEALKGTAYWENDVHDMICNRWVTAKCKKCGKKQDVYLPNVKTHVCEFCGYEAERSEWEISGRCGT